jgi:hypothetical protein
MEKSKPDTYKLKKERTTPRIHPEVPCIRQNFFAIVAAVRALAMKYVDPDKLNVVVSELLVGLSPSDFVDVEEYRLSKEHTALPIGFGLFSHFLLRPPLIV